MYIYLKANAPAAGPLLRIAIDFTEAWEQNSRDMLQKVCSCFCLGGGVTFA